MLPLSEKSIYLERMIQHKSTSYKLFWLRAIVEEYQMNQLSEVSFDKLISRMISEAWYPLIKYRLNFGHQDKLQRIVDYIALTYGFSSKTSKAEVTKLLEFSDEIKQDKAYWNLKKKFYDMVPYRLLSTFFSAEVKGLHVQKGNRVIEALSLESKDCFYKIYVNVSGEKCIKINEGWEQYIYRNYTLIRGWLEHKIILYLQNNNPSVPNIPYKLDRMATRKLKRATDYWKAINWDGRFKDIYTNRHMNKENYDALGGFSIDHYIPWTFVMHDELWVTIPTFKRVNSSKNDKLPDAGRYLDNYCLEHYKAFTLTKERYKNNPKKVKVLEDYLNVGGMLNSEEILHSDVHVNREVFIDSMKQTIAPLFQIAQNQGYETWKY